MAVFFKSIKEKHISYLGNESIYRNVFVFVQLMNNLIKELSRALKFQLKLNAMNEQILHIYRKKHGFS